MLSEGLKQLGFLQRNNVFFDTLHINVGNISIDNVRTYAELSKINFNYIDDKNLTISLLYLVKKNQLFEMEDIVASYQKAILDVLVTKLARSVIIKKVNTCIIAGGVAANKSLRRLVEDKLNDTINVYNASQKSGV